MLDADQATAYAEADFSEPHNAFVTSFQQKHPQFSGKGVVLDLGCGPGDISCRFAKAYPGCTVFGVDGSPAMLNEGVRLCARWGEAGTRVVLKEALLPNGEALTEAEYGAVISNSLLHHMPNATDFWQSITTFAAPGAAIFVMDLLRPSSAKVAKEMMHRYTADEPEVLQQDFYHSLLAAFSREEIQAQLCAAQLGHLTFEQTSDRHWIVWGKRS
ncbi:class I SAM-dependent methyltransferase [Magnetococcus sp. PR-3]|uniref:class I SAM-dependent methyltransferase n=1 Tax=Magnetococcus sp. PR-3 TaxID=3120355 RepID=UPI003FA5D7DF